MKSTLKVGMAKRDALKMMSSNVESISKSANGSQKIHFKGVLKGNFEMYKKIFGEKEADKLTVGLGVHKKISFEQIKKTFEEDMKGKANATNEDIVKDIAGVELRGVKGKEERLVSVQLLLVIAEEMIELNKKVGNLNLAVEAIELMKRNGK